MIDEKASKLFKNCPCCGEKPFVTIRERLPSYDIAIKVECICGLEITRAGVAKAKESIIDLLLTKWNRRTGQL